MNDLQPAPDWDFGKGWAEITPTRFGYHIKAGFGPGVYEVSWFRFRHEAARRKARRIVEKINRESDRREQRERIT